MFLDTLVNPVVRSQVIDVFSNSLQRSWYVAIAFAGLGSLIVMAEREVPLRKELDTEFGMVETPAKRHGRAQLTGQE